MHELSTGRVLTSEYVDAMRWSAALREPQARRDAWGETIARFVFIASTALGCGSATQL